MDLNALIILTLCVISIPMNHITFRIWQVAKHACCIFYCWIYASLNHSYWTFSADKRNEVSFNSNLQQFIDLLICTSYLYLAHFPLTLFPLQHKPVLYIHSFVPPLTLYLHLGTTDYPLEQTICRIPFKKMVKDHIIQPCAAIPKHHSTDICQCGLATIFNQGICATSTESSWFLLTLPALSRMMVGAAQSVIHSFQFSWWIELKGLGAICALLMWHFSALVSFFTHSAKSNSSACHETSQGRPTRCPKCLHPLVSDTLATLASFAVIVTCKKLDLMEECSWEAYGSITRHVLLTIFMSK